MIDVHVLTHSGTQQGWLDQCLASLEEQPVCVYVVEGFEGHVGKGRAKGYALGVNPLVAYVDSDDYVLPGVFAYCEYQLRQHRAVVTKELLEYADGSRHPFPRLGHSLGVYRRDDVLPYLPAMEQSPHSSDMQLRRLLRPVQLDYLGYVWRVHQHGDHMNVTQESVLKESAAWPQMAQR